MNLNEAVNLPWGLRNREPKFSISIPDISIINKITHQTRRQPHKNANIKRFYASLFTCQKGGSIAGEKGEKTQNLGEQRSWTGTQDDYPVIHLLLPQHRTGRKGGVQGAVTPAISVTLPADEVVLPRLACEPVLPLPRFVSPSMLICGLKFSQISGYFRFFNRSQLGLWSGHFVFFDNLLQLPNWTKRFGSATKHFFIVIFIFARLVFQFFSSRSTFCWIFVRFSLRFLFFCAINSNFKSHAKFIPTHFQFVIFFGAFIFFHNIFESTNQAKNVKSDVLLFFLFAGSCTLLTDLKV